MKEKELVTFEPPDLFVLRFKGEWSLDEANDFYDRVDQEKQNIDNLKFMVDASELGNMTPKTRSLATKRSRSLRVSMLAVVGGSAKVKTLGTLLLKMVPQVKKSKFFDTEEEARAWLAE
ncbi:STAS/SEC14 domain-containing protein [candidate division WOR-3 bacterium]|nr:STAS/SEC14 domain-containing protein [candidate division WOR-3 bacterium]